MVKKIQNLYLCSERKTVQVRGNEEWNISNVLLLLTGNYKLILRNDMYQGNYRNVTDKYIDLRLFKLMYKWTYFSLMIIGSIYYKLLKFCYKENETRLLFKIYLH